MSTGGTADGEGRVRRASHCCVYVCVFPLIPVGLVGLKSPLSGGSGSVTGVCSSLTGFGSGASADGGAAVIGCSGSGSGYEGGSDGSSGAASDALLPAAGRSTLSAEVQLAALRVVFVDDEPANVRLGVRLLTSLGVLRSNIIVLVDGQ